MDTNQIRTFTQTYLEQLDCQIIESSPTHILTQLSIPADKDILNRPLYWMYVEKVGLDPQPARFCFIFDPQNKPKDLNGEYLYYGAPRLTQMLNSAQKHGRFVRLYEEPKGWERYGKTSKSYTPWLAMNFKISYLCDRQKDRLCYLGLNMQSGQIKENFYPKIKTMPWTSKLPPQRYTISPRVTIPEAVGELEYYLQEQVQKEDAQWALEAKERLTAELHQLNLYYPEDNQISDELLKEKKQRHQELIWQYHPRIEVSVVTAGLFYMESPIT